MGHLVNASGMRLGWFSNWADSWFVEHLYYTEFLYITFRLRFLFIYIFNSEEVESTGIFYSHFEFVFQGYNMYIDLFLYDGAVEGEIDSFYFSQFVAFRRARKRVSSYRYLPVKWHRTWKLLLTIAMYHYFSPRNWPRRKIRYMLKAIYQLDSYELIQFYRPSNFNYEKHKYFQKGSLYFFLVIMQHLTKIITYGFYQTNVSRNIYTTRLFYATFYVFWRYTVVTGLKRTLTSVIDILDLFPRFKISIYFLSAFSVTAKFLSRYIARKLQQNYRLEELLYPIRNELQTVVANTKQPGLKYVFYMKKKTRDADEIYLFRSSIFKYLLAYLFNAYKKYNVAYYILSGTWFSFDIFFLYLSIFDSYSLKSNNIVNFDNIYDFKFTKQKSYVNPFLDLFTTCFTYFFYRPIYVYFYEYDFKQIERSFNLVFLPTTTFKFNRTWVFFNYLEFMFNDLYVNVNNLMMWIPNGKYNISFLRSAGFYLKRFVRYNYWLYNYNWWFVHLEINKRKRRARRPQPFGFYIGFKLFCMGRFSRKLRKHTQFVLANKLPLNTLSAIIDYGFYSITLRNSTVGVKVWLYKGKGYNDFYFKAI